MASKKKTSASVPTSPVAICGIGLRLPGGIERDDDFWDVLINGKDTQGPIPPSRFNIDGFDDALDGLGAIKTRRGYFLKGDLSASLDTSFFSMSKNELERCDPQQRLLLEVVRECLEDAGELDYRGRRVGCYVGTFGQDWYEMSAKDTQHVGSHTVSGYGDMMLANRVSYEYDLRGPSMVLKTACSGSLVALHVACRAVQIGDAESALVGGTSLILGPSTTSLFFNEGVLSPDASCKTFDARADGFARAEGIACVYIKRLDDALRDGNPIRAVIRGTGSNSDGRSQSLLSPSAAAHEALMRSVYEEAGLRPQDTLLVECHGTGTVVGDPIETAAVGNIFGEHGVFISSVKPNVGHSEGCSGITSVIKAVLSLEHGMIPPQIKFESPNPAIAFAKKKLSIPTSAKRFSADRAERISVNSFGIGGSNAHVILESKTQCLGVACSSTSGCVSDNTLTTDLLASEQPWTNDSSPSLFLDSSTTENLFLLSANSPLSLQQQNDQWKAYLQQHASADHSHLRNIAYTLALRREKLAYRTFLVLNDDRGLLDGGVITDKTSASPPDMIMVFSGQGAQWPSMGRDLISASSSFRSDLARMDEILKSLKKPPEWSLIEELQKPPETSRIHQAEFAQPLCTALQIALYRRLKSLRIMPTAVVGHSSGEIAAAYAAGYISFRHAMILAYYRGYIAGRARAEQLCGTGITTGGMGVVGLDSKSVLQFLRPGICVACENSPRNTTLSGDRKVVEEVLGSIRRDLPDVLARLLKVDVAYHSQHMEYLAQEYQTLVENEGDDITFGANGDDEDNHVKVVFMSSVTCKTMRQRANFAPQYWVSNLVSRVRFSDAISELIVLLHQTKTSRRKADTVFMEIGPHSTLAGPLREICQSASNAYNYISCQTRGSNGVVDLLFSVGRLFQMGIDMDWKAMHPATSQTVSGLPTYPWDHSGPSYWYENRLSSAWRQRTYPHHCLLGIRVVESPDSERLWRNVLHLDHVAWIKDHKVRKDIVFPLAGYVAMIGEAVRQTTNTNGYRLRLVTASTALVLNHEKPVEIVTGLRRRKLNDYGQGEESVWFEFTISSFNGSTWTKHCEGQASNLDKMTEYAQALPGSGREDDLARVVSRPQLYEALTRMGNDYGPEFRVLDRIRSSAKDKFAQATVLSRAQAQAPRAKPFVLHPTSMDGCIQLLLVANARGLCRNLSRVVLPTHISQIEVGPRVGSSELCARAGGFSQGFASAVVSCTAEDGQVVFRMSGLRVIPLDADEGEDDNDIHAAARLHWLPGFDFVDVTQLFAPPPRARTQRRLQERLTLLCILESAEKIAHLTPLHSHHDKYRDWLRLQIVEAEKGQNVLVRDAPELIALSRPKRLEHIEATFADLAQLPGSNAITRAIKCIIDNAEGIFTGERDTMDLLQKQDVLSEMYNDISFGYGDFVRILSHTRPDLRVLEVGAGTGGTTDRTLRALGDTGGLPSYSVYTFSDISAGFFPQAQKRFAYADNMDFATLDIGRDPLSQGFVAASYDLILAPNVVHATPSLRTTLENLKLLLKPDGMLLLTEISTITRTPNYIFGNFSGWWLGEADNRKWEPYVPASRWDQDLKAAGFKGVEAIVADDEMPFQLCLTIMSKPDLHYKKTPTNAVFPGYSGITILCEDRNSREVHLLASSLEVYKIGQQVTFCTLEEVPPAGQHIIACLGLEKLFFSAEVMTEAKFHSFQQFVRHIKNERVLWLTRPFQMQCQDPRSAETLGVLRTLRSELGLQLFTLEIDPSEPELASLTLQVFDKICREEDGKFLDTDKEYAVNNGSICIGRFYPTNIKSEACTGRSSDDRKHEVPLHMCVDKPGRLDTLHWRQDPFIAESNVEPSGNTVDIEVRIVGLNFKDVLLATGVLHPENLASDLQNESESIQLGVEASGIIRKVGPKVRDLRPGDRVMALSPTRALSTSITIPAASVVRIPDSLSFESAATVPVCFATVIYSLLEVGRLKKAQSVLIHSACGGVGLAAIQVCQMVGAEIFATVDIRSEEKIQHLVNHCHIQRDRIFNSRDASFAMDILRESHGRGVDVVLNSLKGELLHESWRCVAEYGTLIELGKRDLENSGRLDMMPFTANRSYVGVDIHRFIRERPAEMSRILYRFLELYEGGLLRPLDPVSCFEANEVEKAFRHLQQASHIGKVIVRLPYRSEDPQIKPSQFCRKVVLDPEAAYLLVGGSTGLGAAIATWLVERGARVLVFLSRGSGVTPESLALYEELEAMGCQVTATACSVVNAEQVERAVEGCNVPCKGVFDLAMVLSDAPMLDMKWDEWETVVKVKVQGAWNLHNALMGHPLDFFWMASSLVSCVDQPGQGNYSAGCAFLEAFCQYRHSQGLPATVVNICPIDGIGYVAKSSKAKRNMRAQGLYFLGEREFLDFVKVNLLHPKTLPGQDEQWRAAQISRAIPGTAWRNQCQLFAGLRSASEVEFGYHLDEPQNTTNWRRDRRMGFYHNVRPDQKVEAVRQAATETSAVARFLSRIPQDETLLVTSGTVEFLATEIGKAVLGFMLRPDSEVNVCMTMAELGLDSLIALELRRWLRQVFGVNMSVLEITSAGTLMQLAEIIREKLARDPHLLC